MEWNASTIRALLNDEQYQELSKSDKLVLVSLVMNPQTTNAPIPVYPLPKETLKNQTGLGMAHVTQSLNRLEDAGWVVVENNVVYLKLRPAIHILPDISSYDGEEVAKYLKQLPASKASSDFCADFGFMLDELRDDIEKARNINNSENNQNKEGDSDNSEGSGWEDEIKEIFKCWVDQENTITHQKIRKGYKKSIRARLRDGMSVDDIKQAIKNYSMVVGGDEYFFDYANWTLKDFVSGDEGERIEAFLRPEQYKDTNGDDNDANEYVDSGIDYDG